MGHRPNHYPWKSRVKRLFPILLPVLILAVGLGVWKYLAATKPEQPPPTPAERVWRVAVEPVVPRRLAPELTLYGRVETPDLLRATAAAAAWVTEVAVRDGDRVVADEVLLRLDERDFLPRIRQVKAEIADLEAQVVSERNRYETDQLALVQERRLLALAREGVERQQRLKSQQVGAEQALDEAEQAEAQQALTVSNREMSIADHPSRLRALEARLQSARARLEVLQLEYERATVRAPYDGIVTGVEVTAGDQVAKGEVLVRMYALKSLEVRARIPAPYQGELIAALEQGEPLPAIADLDARAGAMPVQLILDRLAGEADPSGVDGLFRVAGDPARLRIGQLLRLRLNRPLRADAVAVPFQAVYGGDRLYVVEDGRLRAIDVEGLGGQVGSDGMERLLVRSPALEVGDLLVTTHMPNAVDGLKVEVVDSGPTPAPTMAKTPSDAGAAERTGAPATGTGAVAEEVMVQ
jgi:multidrug efflux pump subunit AcrA (membrane-fusion protein)